MNVIPLTNEQKKLVKEDYINKYVEKLICLDCKEVSFREPEIYELALDNSPENVENVYGVLVKDFVCPKCESKKFNSYLVKKESVKKE